MALHRTHSPVVTPVMRKGRPRVVDVAGQIRHEAGPVFDPYAQRLAMLVHFSENPQVSRSAQTLAGEFIRAGYTTAMISSATCGEPLRFSEGGDLDGLSVYRRPNTGYDFGSWASFLNAFPQIRKAPRVILANDSLVGPFDRLDDILRGFEQCPTDIWGITGTTQDSPHLQSHFVGYKDGVLDEPALRRFWRDVRLEPSKRDLILRYEIGLSQLAYAEGYVLAAHFPWHWVTSLGGNPTSQGWYRLILQGFPFVKRELVLRAPPEVPDAGSIPAVVRQLWGEEVTEWV